jgi:RNA polymerase sigma factor (sigma-70 family)
MSSAVVAPLTREQQLRVERLLPELDRATEKLRAVARNTLERDEVKSIIRLAWTVAASRFDPSYKVEFRVYAWLQAEARVLDAMRTESRIGHLRKAMEAENADFLSRAEDPSDVLRDTDQDRRRQRREWHTTQIAGMALSAVAAMLNDREPEDLLIRKEAYTALGQARAALRTRDQKILELHYDKGTRLEDVAAALELSWSTVRNRHRISLDRLLTLLSARGIKDAGLK